MAGGMQASVFIFTIYLFSVEVQGLNPKGGWPGRPIIRFFLPRGYFSHKDPKVKKKPPCRNIGTFGIWI
jgi:hypothetical protein